MNGDISLAVALAVVSTVMLNVAYLREHDAAATLPCLTMRRPLRAVRLLLGDRRWLVGFGLEAGGFLVYAAALALAPLAVIQSIAAGGIGVLAFVSSRTSKRGLRRRARYGVLLSVLGLTALGVSFAQSSTGSGQGSLSSIGLWLAATGVIALVVMTAGRRVLGAAVADGIAGGLLFSIGDISTKVATQGGTRVAFLLTLVVGYASGTALLQLGYQAGGALTVAGLATLLTNAVPIAAGTIVLAEPVPAGALGTLRVIAFIAVCAGAFLLAQPDPTPQVAAPPPTESCAGEGAVA